MVNIAFTWEKVYFESSCHSHTPMSDPFALGKSRFFFFCFFSQEPSIVQDISFGTKHRYTMLWWVNKHTISRCYCTLVCNFTSTYMYIVWMPWKALQNWTNLNNTQVSQMHIYLPPKTKLHGINFKKKGNLWKGHSFTICTDCMGATATVFKTNHYIWC